MPNRDEPYDREVEEYEKFVKQGKSKVHYCPDWDFMAIHEESPEFESCCCDFEK